MAVYYVGSYSLGTINAALSTEVIPLLLQIEPLLLDVFAALDELLITFDLLINAEFGLGGLKLSLSLQLDAAISAAANISLAIGNPILYFQGVLSAMLSAVAALEAQIEAALSAGIGIPPISASASAQLSASISLAASIKAQLLGIQLLIDLALEAKIPALEVKAQLELIIPTLQLLIGNLQANLNVTGGIHLYRLDGPAITVAAELQAAFAANLGINGSVNIKCLLVVVDVTANATAFNNLSAILKVDDTSEVVFP